MFTPSHLLHHLLHDVQTQGRARVIDEQLLLTLDFFDVVVTRDIPERRVALWRELFHRRVLAQPGKLVMNPLLIAPVCRIYHGLIQSR